MKRKKIITIISVIIIILILGFFIVPKGYRFYYENVVKENNTKLKESQQKELELTKRRNEVLKEANLLVQGYFVNEAITLLNKDKDLINNEINKKITEYTAYKNSFVPYTDIIQHIFFHSLILYPEYLFPDLNKPTGGYNEGFSYKRELERMLPQLLERGYVLYNINDVFSKDENGKMIQKDIYLPVGKKPLILSIDDPSYHYGIGFAHQMIVDDSGQLATIVITPDNKTITTHDGDVELVINNFVKDHPEFSYRGAKGIIASTGYLGFLGHKLDTEESKQSAVTVANKLKEEGWLFASHSYTHNRDNYWGPGSNASKIAWDTKKWKEVIEPIVGKTNIFIAPFGYTLSGSAMNVIIQNGFDIYCNVVAKQKITVYDTYALMGRIEMGGYSYTRYKQYLNDNLFDVDAVKDAYRPPISK